MGDVGDITHRLPAVAEPQFRRLGHFSFTSATAHMVPMFESSARAPSRAPPGVAGASYSTVASGAAPLDLGESAYRGRPAVPTKRVARLVLTRLYGPTVRLNRDLAWTCC